MSGYFRVTCGTVLAGLLAFLAGTAEGAAEAARVSFRVTLQATVTKDWNTVIETTQAECPASLRSVGRRTVTLRSARPTTVIVTFGSGRVSYSPAAVRYVAGEVVQTGNRTTRLLAPCTARTIRSRCARVRRAVSGARFGFFRSGRNEISFHPARLPAVSASCPGESAGVRAIRPSLQEAEGGLSEVALADSRIPSQTAFGSAELETDLEGAETGRVIERVRWELTFTRKR